VPDGRTFTYHLAHMMRFIYIYSSPQNFTYFSSNPNLFLRDVLHPTDCLFTKNTHYTINVSLHPLLSLIRSLINNVDVTQRNVKSCKLNCSITLRFDVRYQKSVISAGRDRNMIYCV